MRNLHQKRLGGEIVCNVKIFQVERDLVAMPDGKEVIRASIRKPSAVVIVALTEQGKVLLVRQWRYPVDKALIELPAGGLEAGEAPEAAVRRELQEEAGYLPRHIVALNESFPVPGYCDERFYFYLATDLQPSVLPGDADEDIEVVEMDLDEALQDPLVREDGKTLLGLFLAKEYLGKM